MHELVHATGQNQWLWRDVAFCAIYVVLLVVALRAGVPKAWVAAGALIVLLPLESGSFTSDGRFGLLGSSLFLVVAVLGLLLWDRFAVVSRATRRGDAERCARAGRR